MYAIVETGGKQYKVSQGDILKVEKIDAQSGSEFELNKILFINKDGDILTGAPYIQNAKVLAEVIDSEKDKKVIVFKFKNRKGYQRKKGHRQIYTKLKIKDIVA